MAMNKKGVFFTIISLIIFSSLLYFYISNNQRSYTDDIEVVESRVKTMDTYIADIEQDVERGLYISSMRSLIGMSDFMVTNGTFVDDFGSAFNELMLNGSINNQQINITLNNTFRDWIDKIIILGGKLNIDVKFHNMHVHVFQDSPWAIKMTATGIVNLTDRKGIASWLRPLNITAELEIIDFEDPLYTVNTKGKIVNKVSRRTATTPFDTGSNLNEVILHINNSIYIDSASAPSFIMRFEGNTSPSPVGIVSVVNLKEIETSAIEFLYANAACEDYLYFNTTTTPGCIVNETKGTLSWLRLAAPSIYDASCD